MPITATNEYKDGRKVVGVSDEDAKQAHDLMKAGVGQPGPISPVAAKAVLRLQDPTDGASRRYKDYVHAVAAAFKSSNPRVRAEVEEANRAYMQVVQKASPSASSVHTDSTMANMSTQYANDEFIGEALMPPVLVSKQSDVYATYGKRDRLAQPHIDEIAEGGETPEVTESRSTGSYACVNRGFKRGVAATAVANQDAPLDELFDLTASLLDHRALARELRIATVLTTAGNYPSGNKATLSGADQWNASGGGDPIGKMQAADAALWRGIAPAATKGFCSLDIYNVLSRHEDFLGLFQYSGSPIGLATPKMIAGFLGWDDLLVGRGRYDSTPLAAAATYSRIWGDYFGVLRVAQRQTIRSATFGMTMRWTMPGVMGANSGILTQQWFDETKDLGGTHFAKVGESECHEIQASDCGYLYSDCLA